jgi:hypothetical protein
MKGEKSAKGDDVSLSYCAGGTETFARLAEWIERRQPDIMLAEFPLPTAALARLAATHEAGFCDYPDPAERVRFWDEHLRERAAVRDDAVPCAYLSEFDQGLYAGLLGGAVRFLCDPQTGWISSMVPPLFDDLSRARDLPSPTDSPWWPRYLAQLDLFARASAGKFGLSHFILIDSLNFAFELVGATKTYLALAEAPDDVARAIGFAHDLNVLVQEAFFERTGLVAGGTCSNMVGWVRGRIVNESVDPFHMTSVADFERWGRAPIERMFRHFDGGVLHIHGNGRHLLEAVATLPRLRAVYLGDDRRFPPAFSVLPEIRRRVGDLPLVCAVPFSDFVDALDRRALTGGVKYVVSGAPDADAANRAMERVREHRP